MIDWTACKQIAAWTPLSGVPVSAAKVSRGIYQIADEAFFVASEYNSALIEDGGGPYVTVLAWAPTVGALRRVRNLESDSDEMVEQVPPEEMLLPGSDGTYGSLFELARQGPPGSYLEHAAYRIAGDGHFCFRTLEAGSFSFHFRERSGTTDLPFCVYFRLPNARRA